MIAVLSTDMDGFPRSVKCSLCESSGVRPAADRDGRWLLDWARSHRCVATEVRLQSLTNLQ
jgi:hypothetical protein